MSADEEEPVWEGSVWNYRVLRLKEGAGFAICSVGYEKADGPVKDYSLVMSFFGDTVDELKELYALMSEAFDHPPIDPQD